MTPVKFTDISDTTRKWLDELREEDTDDYSAILKAWRRWGNVFWFLKWAFLAAFSSFIGTVTLGESIVKALAWIRGGP